jgi:hypothetical protein
VTLQGAAADSLLADLALLPPPFPQSRAKLHSWFCDERHRLVGAVANGDAANDAAGVVAAAGAGAAVGAAGAAGVVIQWPELAKVDDVVFPQLSEEHRTCVIDVDPYRRNRIVVGYAALSKNALNPLDVGEFEICCVKCQSWCSMP